MNATHGASKQRFLEISNDNVGMAIDEAREGQPNTGNGYPVTVRYVLCATD